MAELLGWNPEAQPNIFPPHLFLPSQGRWNERGEIKFVCKKYFFWEKKFKKLRRLDISSTFQLPGGLFCSSPLLPAPSWWVGVVQQAAGNWSNLCGNYRRFTFLRRLMKKCNPVSKYWESLCSSGHLEHFSLPCQCGCARQGSVSPGTRSHRLGDSLGGNFPCAFVI